MSTIFSISNHELRRMFKSPLAWVILAVVQFLLAQLFLKYWEVFETRGSAFADVGLTQVVVTSLYHTCSLVLLLVTPFITMRSFSEERRNGTMGLLLSSPVSITELVIGKYLSILAFFMLITGMITLMPLSLGMGTQLDYWQLASAVIGLTLLVAAFSAIGLFISTLTASTAIAAIATFGVLFLLWIINLAATSGSEQVAAILGYISILNHYNRLLEGIFNTADIFYYLIISIMFIVLSIWRLDVDRVS